MYSGHFEEVTGLALVGGKEGGAKRVVSVSIDGTVRTWSLDAAEVRKTREEAEKREMGEVKDEVVEERKEGMMTAEEEAELADLMDDED